ncbi:flotillin family protein [Phytoactinopolyspora alkaliphila]|uniref:Flotillin family protein n=1 Tax=Phytoactinopolyspora alkaliphila TaxID=1783498 RepID=A0A6N9YRR1_9ACTN|nr:SPFH domain-containing protein [Phytoactinopolyspora alkaliphila]NED97518.1 flotillin family protein [Phytoactinopolyspora alkaliphila]
METLGTGFGVLLAVILIVLLGLVFVITRLFRKVEQGRALIISKVKRVDVTFTGAVVLPIIHKAEFMDISVKTIDIERTGHEGLICKDNIRADIRITFFVRVNKTVEDVVKVAQAIGTARASDQNTLQELFNAKFSEALKTVGKHMDFVDLYTKRDEFRDQIIRVIGTDLNGYSLEDAAIDFLEQTPMSQLDGQNILDAQGIRKITELTALEHIRTNDYERNREKEITRQNVDAREAILELERRQADAEATQQREVDTLRAREEAETARVRAEERFKAEAANLRTDEQIGVQNENKAREIAVAELNRQRVVAVETEKIEKDRMLEVVARDRETELATIEMAKEVETEKRAVAEIVRERVAVDKTVAEQEENIKRVRTVEEAEREREARVITAEAEAQENLVKDIKAAEAAEQAAKHKAQEELVLADARQQAAELDAQAKIRLAEGTQAEAAAAGLADVQVRERDAEVIEKVGRAEASAAREKALVEAEAIREKLKGEAEGLTEKAAAMAALDDASREHEEFRLRLEMEKDVRLASLNVQKDVAEAQASVLATGLEQADISIVGGESVFFDRLMSSISLGKGVDGFVGNSEVVSTLAKPWLNGSSSFVDDITGLLGSFDTEDLKNLTVSALLMQLIGKGGPNTAKLQGLLDTARSLGFADQPVAALTGAKQ